MQKRWRLCVLSLLAILLATCIAWIVVRSGPRISPAAYAQIKVGMTKAEVEALIAAPPGDYSAGGIRFMMTDIEPPDPTWEAIKAGAQCVLIRTCEPLWLEPHSAVWTGCSYEIAVDYDNNDRVTRKGLCEYMDGPRWWTRLLHLVGIQ